MDKKTRIIIDRLRGHTLDECAATVGCGKSYVSGVLKAYIEGIESGATSDGDGENHDTQFKKYRSEKMLYESKLRKLEFEQKSDNLIPCDEVKMMFNKVFQSYRQATREIDRRYGAAAAQILINAERSALRMQEEDERLQDMPKH